MAASSMSFVFVLQSCQNAAENGTRQAHGHRASETAAGSAAGDEGRAGRQSRDARRGANLRLRLSARGRTAGAGAVRGLALPARVRQRPRLSLVSLARDRAGRMVCEPGLRLCARRRARLRPVRRRIRVHGSHRAGGLRRADRLDRKPALVQRPGRRHRAILLRHGAMADGDDEPARPRLHRALRRARRSVPLLELSRRDFLQLPLVLVREPARRQSASSRRCKRPAADALRSRRRDHRAHALRRLVARALAVRAARRRSKCRCSRSGTGARWGSTCAATFSASRR